MSVQPVHTTAVVMQPVEIFRDAIPVSAILVTLEMATHVLVRHTVIYLVLIYKLLSLKALNYKICFHNMQWPSTCGKRIRHVLLVKIRVY